ncbi:hypothetical protein AWJ19_03195 [Paenibacillus sp. DMB5]|nr:hypothetical protein AWJ19_03195 [Paenibacillus sp. DMB5]
MSKQLNRPMTVKDVQEALQAGERHFIADGIGGQTVVQEVIRWGNSYVRYTTPHMKDWISTNIRTFAWGVFGVYKEGDCPCGSGGADGIVRKGDSSREGIDKGEAGRVPRNGPENKSLRK